MATALLAAAGCKKSRGDVIDAHRDAVKAKLERMHEVAAGQPVMGPTSAAALEGPAPDFSDGASSNALVVDREEITDLTKASDLKVRIARLSEDPVRVAKSVTGMARAKGGSVNGTPESIGRTLERLERARYVLVLDAMLRLPPAPMGTHFSTGHVRGKARLYDLESGKLVVVFPVDAKNSPEIFSRSDQVIDKLRDNLSYQLGEAIIAGIKKAIPGATPPAGFGYTSW